MAGVVLLVLGGSPAPPGALAADAVATHRLTSNPFVQAGQKLAGSGELGFGYVSALSGDGGTLLVGTTPVDQNKGHAAAWIYTRAGNAWVQQGPKLIGNRAGADSYFGWAVALSADGNTALVGDPSEGVNVGAAWVFTRSGSTWRQQGAKLTGGGEVGNAQFGGDVALSADGNTAFITGITDDSLRGAVWVFTRSAGVWRQQAGKLTIPSGADGAYLFGAGLALSGDGKTALVSFLLPGPDPQSTRGGAWVFTRSGSSWSSQNGRLTATGGDIRNAVALSSNGNTALIGAPNDNSNLGAAFVFTRAGTTWSQQGGPLGPADATGAARFGGAVALSGDGNTALIGGSADAANRGAAWAFARSGGAWRQSGSKIVGGGETGLGGFGASVGLSTSGATAIVSAPSDGNGALWTFGTSVPASPPALSALRIIPRAFTAGPGRRATISFRLSAPAHVSLVFATVTRGHLVGGKCTRLASATAKSTCSLYLTAGRLDVHGRKGVNRVAFTRALPPHTYRLTAVASDGTHQSRALTTFTIR